jgi:hypothetical protein
MPGVDPSAVPAPEKFPHGSGFWAVAFAFLIVMENRPAGSRRPARLPVPPGNNWAAGPPITGRRDEMSSDFVAVRVPEVAS